MRDIDSKRMLLRIERGKGGRYRNAMLPEGLLVLLREWWRAGRQQGVLHADGWLFPGQNATVPISTRQLYRVVVQAAEAADIAKRKFGLIRSKRETFRGLIALLRYNHEYNSDNLQRALGALRRHEPKLMDCRSADHALSLIQKTRCRTREDDREEA